MKNFLKLFLVLLTGAIFFSSCSNTIKEARFIPKDATFVLVAQPASLNDKLTKANISLDTLYKEFSEKDSSFNLKFEELKNCGVNWLGNMFVYMHTKSGANNSQTFYINTLVNINDSSKIVAFIKKHNSKNVNEIKSTKDFSYLKVSDEIIISWSNKYAIITAAHTTFQTPKFPSDSISKVQFIPTDNKNTTDDLLQQVTAYYTQKEEESVASVKQFTDMFKEKADAYTYSSTNGFLNSLNNLPYLQLPKLQELLRDNYSTSAINFADGQIEVKGNSYTNASLSALFKKYPGTSINTSYIQNYPSNNINGFMLFAFNPQIFTGLLKELGVEPIADSYLDKSGFTTADIFKCFKGDIALTVSDVNFSDSLVNGKKAPLAKMLIDANVGDKVSLDKIMSKAVESGFIIKTGNTYTGGDLVKSMGITVQIDDKHFIVATDSLLYNTYIAQTAKSNISNDVLEKIKGKSSAIYVNIESIAEASKNKNFKNIFKDAIVTGNNFDGSKFHTEAILRMKDDKQNSLAVLMKLMPEFANTARKKNITADDIKGLSFLKFL
ncbi:MAG: DUF4836 family protein [Bacteroidetes bacterium]|nr:DUF4836 family protein [Bacteroidota bacterium]MBS1649475.1 DUF4836 family protein [Bacteroidota bacterium]